LVRSLRTRPFFEVWPFPTQPIIHRITDPALSGLP
jgi:hypothetical protein